MTSKLLLTSVPLVTLGIGWLSFDSAPAAIPIERVALTAAAEPQAPNETSQYVPGYRYGGGYRWAGYPTPPPNYNYGAYRYSGYSYSPYQPGYRYIDPPYNGYSYSGYRYSAYRYSGYGYSTYRYYVPLSKDTPTPKPSGGQ